MGSSASGDRTASEEKHLLHGSHVGRPKSTSSVTDCCSAEAQDAEIIRMSDTLRRFFRDDYDLGYTFDHKGHGYNFGYHRDIKSPAMLHVESGILVLEFAVDLRSAEDIESTVVFHYTSVETADKIAQRGLSDDEVREALERNSLAVIKSGILASGRSPEQFGTKDSVLLGLHWPVCGDPSSGPDSPANLLMSGGGEGSDPSDPSNAAVVEAILNDGSIAGQADCCIPILVDRSCVFAAYAHSSASEKVDLDVWRENDIKIVNLSHQDLTGGGADADFGCYSARSATSNCDRRFTVMQKRVDQLEDALGPTSQEALLALGLLASNLRQAGQYVEAAALQRRWVQTSALRMGIGHKNTLIAMGSLGCTLRKMERFAEAEELERRRLKISQSTFGSVHPATLSAFRGLKRIFRDQGRTEEADEFRKKEMDTATKLGVTFMPTMPTVGSESTQAGWDYPCASMSPRMTWTSPRTYAESTGEPSPRELEVH